jgi:hypothetical protein
VKATQNHSAAEIGKTVKVKPQEKPRREKSPRKATHRRGAERAETNRAGSATAADPPLQRPTL